MDPNDPFDPLNPDGIWQNDHFWGKANNYAGGGQFDLLTFLGFLGIMLAAVGMVVVTTWLIVRKMK